MSVLLCYAVEPEAVEIAVGECVDNSLAVRKIEGTFGLLAWEKELSLTSLV